MGETLRRVANGPKMSNFHRTLCLKWAITLKGSIFGLWHRKAKWLRIKFYPRKHPSHVQIAHRELSGGSQIVLKVVIFENIVPIVGSKYQIKAFFWPWPRREKWHKMTPIN